MNIYPKKQTESTILPLEKSYSLGVVGEQLNKLFIQVYRDLFEEKVKQIMNYGSPTSIDTPLLVEHFSKQKGLVVYNNNANIKSLKVLYEAWTGLSTKRGLGFIEFILKTLWGDAGYYINRIYHPIATIAQYPNQQAFVYKEGMMVTSRVQVGVFDKRHFVELQKLAPTLQQIAPANIVIDVMAGVDLGSINIPMSITMSFN